MRAWMLALFFIPFSIANAADVILLLEEKANLTPAWMMSDRVERIKFVYDRLQADAEDAQKDIRAFLDANKISYQSFYLVNAIAVKSVDAATMEKLASFPKVKKILSNEAFLVHKPLPVTIDRRRTMDVSYQDTILAIDAQRVWNELQINGAGIVVAGQDSGYDYRHGAIRRQYRGYNPQGDATHDYNWHDAIHQKFSPASQTNRCGYDLTVPCDDGDHGTHTMGSIVGDDGANNRIGVAPGAKWIGCRNMDEGYGTPASYLECFEYFLAPYPVGGNAKAGKPELAPHVINNSWGCPRSEGCQGEEFVSAIRNLHAAGIMVVVSAGNEGPNCGTVGDPPAMYSGLVFSVGAFDQKNNRIAYFSSRGPSVWNQGIGVNISAPGVGVRSSIPGPGDGTYGFMSGTSMAGPHVVGAVALLWSGRPEFIGKIEDTMRRLELTSVPKTTSQNCGNFPGMKIPNAVFGYGLLNTYRALQNIQ